MSIILRHASLKEIHLLYNQLPEFDAYHSLNDMEMRIADKPHLVRIAEIDGELAGFKLGYALDKNCFYSWLGGVLPGFRREGVAHALLRDQELWAQSQGYSRVSVNTRNRFKEMLLLLVSRDYQLVALQPGETAAEHKLRLEKAL
ncbi:GNAT family N-acetyltransferase [Izhakiella australiensis]|uniref:GNAT family N-acetyltransferase n=1 Tax=Izhakiella australiensis TaxID=1926881 RepID=A0A1S8YKB8_9GAMM|nr:GNAT family N-acetyltransferase [Izhakiella australiensis]OON39460.1 GNAT family N-acetyltransferase [Izhakiella australiensis]